jgi:hypothetical protein
MQVALCVLVVVTLVGVTHQAAVSRGDLQTLCSENTSFRLCTLLVKQDNGVTAEADGFRRVQMQHLTDKESRFREGMFCQQLP